LLVKTEDETGNSFVTTSEAATAHLVIKDILERLISHTCSTKLLRAELFTFWEQAKHD